ncbi:sigma-70 family RNA polymerase sigma factor [uncultured Duncaniella sp.]|uniref:sigma-70 family RNA polymerase sigma factor n=1 Tax=uncultured Duncaniella sp. TaxID=2768039 RepID=UPI0025B4C49E|nr:sigma-70 family RNA polymerase sigma factor [uncultured Duncaniella sp.]
MMTTDDIEQLFRSNYKAMLILAKRLLHDEESARDIVHDVFASLLSGNVKTATTAYLLNGVRFACLKHIRHLSVRERLNSLYAVDCQEIEDDKWPDDEDIAKLNDIVDSHLPEQTRRIVRLRFCELMTYKEISKLLSISEVSVYKHLRHAMNVLRQYFNEHER